VTKTLDGQLFSVTSFSSIASVFVFTKPIEMSMFLIQSSFSANSTGLPCTPMFGDTSAGANDDRCHGERLRDTNRLDRNVNALAVSEGQDLLFPVRVTRVDRVGGAEVRCALQTTVVEVDRDDLRWTIETSGLTAASPTGPEPITATTSPGFTSPYFTPISKPVGKMSDNKMPSESDRLAGIL